MKMPALKDFALVGGTALSLRYGHRTSIDLDLFNDKKFDAQEVHSELENAFGDVLVFEDAHPKWAIFCYIEKVKVDIVYYSHSTIAPIREVDGIRMYDSMDIAAMKIQAILGRGRKKDFWDLYELLHHFTLEQIIEWHSMKFPSQRLLISIPNAVTYFEDADESDEPVSLKGQTWEGVKDFIKKKVRDYLQ